jgi:glutaminyl-peptide cyclotransferase
MIFPSAKISTLMKKRIPRRLALTFLIVALAQTLLVQSSGAEIKKNTPQYTFKIVRTFPHDSNAFTQGLEYHDGFLYESTGLEGRSSLRKVRLETGDVLQHIDLPSKYFAEGITIFKDQIVQLTWQSHAGFVYDLSDFRLLRQFSYPGEGWGLANDGREIFMSDGTSQLRVLDPTSLEEKRRFTVHDGNKPIHELNELEWVEGEIFANIWQTDRIARISPKTGEVLGWIDLAGLLSPIYQLPQGAVLNGIAYDPEHKRLFVTGKLWPKIFEIQIVPKK